MEKKDGDIKIQKTQFGVNNMTYKIKKSKEKMKFDEETEYYLVDVKKNTYDNHVIKGWKNATRLNLVYQSSSGNDYIVPMEKNWVEKKKLKQGNFLAK